MERLWSAPPGYLVQQFLEQGFTAVAITFFYGFAVRHIGAKPMSGFIALVPIFVVIDSILLKLPLSTLQLVGAATTGIGVLAFNLLDLLLNNTTVALFFGHGGLNLSHKKEKEQEPGLGDNQASMNGDRFFQQERQGEHRHLAGSRNIDDSAKTTRGFP